VHLALVVVPDLAARLREAINASLLTAAVIREWAQGSARAASMGQVSSDGAPVAAPKPRSLREKGGEES
jgi:hypothetical protein